jgi:hypothetical protein
MSESVKLATESLHNGIIRISIITDEEMLSIELNQIDSAKVAAKILEMAHDSHTESGNPREDYTKQSTEWALVFPTTMCLHEYPTTKFWCFSLETQSLQFQSKGLHSTRWVRRSGL